MNAHNGDRVPQARVSQRAHELVLTAAVEVFGATRSEEPVEGYQILTRTVLDDPLAAVRAAGLLARIAASRRTYFAEQAREVGRSWDEIGQALDLPDDGARRRAEGAFEWLIEGRPPEPAGPADWLFREPATSWRCATCDRAVVDRGPFESHPDDNETGHAPDCARHQAALAEHRRQLEEDES